MGCTEVENTRKKEGKEQDEKGKKKDKKKHHHHKGDKDKNEEKKDDKKDEKETKDQGKTEGDNPQLKTPIEIKKEDNKIKIVIPLENNPDNWQKEYDPETKVDQVVNDYINENNVIIPKGYFMNMILNKKQIKLEDQIKLLITDNSSVLFLNQELQLLPLEIGENIDDSPEIVGKLFINPIHIMTYLVAENTFKVKIYDDEKIIDAQLYAYNITSSYCNGGNHLFISGGSDPNGEPISKFWDFDLKDDNIFGPINIKPKNNHSMIFIPSKYVFIVGGNDQHTFYYTIDSQEISEWNDLNLKRIEPSLIKVNNFLFCFDNISNLDNFSCEKTDLLSSDHSWELMNPQESSNIIDRQIGQRFFGISKDLEGKIIFLGGDIYDDEEEKIEGRKNYQYDMNSNKIELSEVPFVKLNLKEKTFITYNNKSNISFILPNFKRQHPEVYFYLKDKNVIKAVDFVSNKTQKGNKENKQDENIPESNTIKKENTQFNFNMPFKSNF